MKLKSLISLIPLSLLALPATAQDSTGVSSEIVYGVIDLDNIFNNTSHFEQQFSIVNYKFYLTPLQMGSSPYEVQTHLERVSSVSTNMTWYLANTFNISGRQYFDSGFDVQYTVSESSSLNSLDIDDGKESLVGMHLNFPAFDNLQLGLGAVRSTDEYFSYSRGTSWEERTNIQMEYRASLTYHKIVDGKGWFIESLFSVKGQSTNDDTIFTTYVEGQYFTDQLNSYRFRLGNYIDNGYQQEKLYSLGISKKTWFSFNTSLDYGISYTIGSEKEPFDETDNYNLLAFDLNGTWRF